MEYPTYLIHYGIPNQKWGVRRFQNEDGTWTEEGLRRRRVDTSKLPHYGEKGKIVHTPGRNKEDDFIINKGSLYERITTKKNEKFNDRTYVSADGSKYTEYLVDLNKDYYIDTLKTKKDVIVAGEKTIRSILNDIGNEPAKNAIKALDLNKERDSVPFNSKENIEKYNKISNEYYDYEKYLDFLYKDEYKIADDFINILKARGYDGLLDPVDNIAITMDPQSTIFVKDVLKRVKQEKYRM